MKKLHFRGIVLAAALATTSLFSGCGDEDEDVQDRIQYGPEVNMGNGTARSFIKLDGSGKAASLGFTLSKGAIENLPHEEASFLLALPTLQTQLSYNHISVDWTPHGHFPDGVYNTPHFDMHFYMVSPAERNEIKLDEKMEILPDARFLPPTYQQVPGEGVPQMGKHWVDVTGPELQGKPFTSTFVYGSYNGRVIFHEPMMAHDWLMTRPDTVMTIPQPTAVERSGLYPGKYSVQFEDAKQQYVISFNELALRQQP